VPASVASESTSASASAASPLCSLPLGDISSSLVLDVTMSFWTPAPSSGPPLQDRPPPLSVPPAVAVPAPANGPPSSSPAPSRGGLPTPTPAALVAPSPSPSPGGHAASTDTSLPGSAPSGLIASVEDNYEFDGNFCWARDEDGLDYGAVSGSGDKSNISVLPYPSCNHVCVKLIDLSDPSPPVSHPQVLLSACIVLPDRLHSILARMSASSISPARLHFPIGKIGNSY
jgi:hypothetical protein